jgi:hypothetical protein
MTSPKNSENSDDSSSSSHQQTAAVIHEFVLVRKARHCHRDDEEENDGNNNNDDDNENRYELEQGENWLKFLPKPGRSVLDDTQDIGMTQEQYPSIWSLASVGSLEVDLPSKDCYLCIDVDGDVIAVKDMRLPDGNMNNDSDGGGGGEMIASLELKQNHNELGISRKDVWEPLSRRQLRLLSAGDKVCTALGHMADGTSFPGGLIFQYRSMERVNIQANSSSKSSLLFLKEEIVKPEPTTPGGMVSIFTQPQEDEKEELETQTEPTPVKSSKDDDDDMDIAKDDGNDDDDMVIAKDDGNDDADDDSEKTLEFEVQHPLGPSEILATQPNSDSDDETSLGDGERHSGDSNRLDPIPDQVVLTRNSKEEDDEDDDDEAEEELKAVPVKDKEPEDSQATVSDSQLTDALGQESQNMMTQFPLRNSQLTAVLQGETTQDATQATIRNSQLPLTLWGETQDGTQATQLAAMMALQGETQDNTQATQLAAMMAMQGDTQNDTQVTVRNSQLPPLALWGETQDETTRNTQLTVAFCEETQDATQGTARESSLTNTGLVQIQEIDDNDKEMEEASESSDFKSETLLGETGPDRPSTESFPDHPIIQDVSKDDDAGLSMSVETGRVSLSQESNLQDKKPTLEKDAIPLNTALSSEPVTGSTEVDERENSAPPANDNRLEEKVGKDLPGTSENEAGALANKANGSPTNANNEKNENRSQNDAPTLKMPIESERAADADVLVESTLDDEKEKSPPPLKTPIESECAADADVLVESALDENEKSPPTLTTPIESERAAGADVLVESALDEKEKSPPTLKTPIESERAADADVLVESALDEKEKSPPPTLDENMDDIAEPNPQDMTAEDVDSVAEQEGKTDAGDKQNESIIKNETTNARDQTIQDDNEMPQADDDDDNNDETQVPGKPAPRDVAVELSTPAPRSSRRSRKSPSSSNTPPETQPASKRQRIEDTEASRSAPRSTTKRKGVSTVAPASSRNKKQSSPTGRPGRKEESADIRVMTTGISLTDPQKHVSAFRLYRTSM